jgi:MFS family permease
MTPMVLIFMQFSSYRDECANMQAILPRRRRVSGEGARAWFTMAANAGALLSASARRDDMIFYIVVALTVLNHIAYKGSKMLVSLYAIDFGGTPFEVGMLFSLYSIFSLFTAIHVGRMSDRVGPRRLMLVGCCGLGAGLLLPFFWPRMGMLYVSATLIGALYIFFTVSAQHLIGAAGEGHARTRNFGFYSLGVGLTSLCAPPLTGYAIDHFGHQVTYALLALFPAATLTLLLLFRRTLPRGSRKETPPAHRPLDLLRNVPLRRALITAGIVETGGELYNFYMPIYGHSIGLSASRIGLIIGVFGAAILLARGLMPALVRRSSEETVLFGSLAMTAGTCVLFPFVTDPVMLAAISFVLGLGLGCCGPLSMILTYNRAPEGRAGEAIGFRQSFNKFIEVVMPLLFGTLGTAFGLGPAFWLNAVLLGSGAALMKADAGRRTPRKPPD